MAPPTSPAAVADPRRPRDYERPGDGYSSDTGHERLWRSAGSRRVGRGVQCAVARHRVLVTGRRGVGKSTIIESFLRCDEIGSTTSSSIFSSGRLNVNWLQILTYSTNAFKYLYSVVTSFRSEKSLASQNKSKNVYKNTEFGNDHGKTHHATSPYRITITLLIISSREWHPAAYGRGSTSNQSLCYRRRHFGGQLFAPPPMPERCTAIELSSWLVVGCGTVCQSQSDHH